MLSKAAETRDDAAAHAQLALLYKAQLRLLLRMRPDTGRDRPSTGPLAEGLQAADAA